MTFTVALMIAVSYWGARDIQTPCHPQPAYLTNEQMAVYNGIDGVEADMRADRATCEVLIAPTGRVLRTLDEPVGWSYCREVVHEVGHIDGLTHEHEGVMSAGPGGHVPWACTHVKVFLRNWTATHTATRGR